MKPIIQTVAAFTIALVFGASGYFFGKKHSSISPPSARSESSGNSHVRSPRRDVVKTMDVKEMRTRLDAEKNPLTRFKLAVDNLDDWINQNPQDALDWLASQAPTRRRDEVMRMALKQFAENDPKGAADWARKNLSGADLNNMLIIIAGKWARENGLEAATWFQGQPENAERDAAMETIFFNWASDEPAAALEYLKANSSLGDLSATLRKAALAGWAKSEPEAAVTASLALSKTNGDLAQFANTLANWGTVDLAASSQWLLDNLPVGDARTAAAEELAIIFAQQSPEAGLAWLEKLNSGAERDQAASSLIAEWSRNDPAGAAKWATDQKLSDLSSLAMARMTQNFMAKNPTEFQTWRAALSPGPLKDQADKVRSYEVAEDEE